MIAVITVRGAPAITPPLVGPDPHGCQRVGTEAGDLLQVRHRRRGASFGWTFSTKVPVSGAILAYSGVESATPFDPSMRPTAASRRRRRSIVAPSITTTADGDLLIGVFGAPSTRPSPHRPAWSSRARSPRRPARPRSPPRSRTSCSVPPSHRQPDSHRRQVGPRIGQVIALPPEGAPGSDSEKPTVPTNLAATATAPTQVDLTWTASTDNVRVDHYVVWRAEGATAGDFNRNSQPDAGPMRRHDRQGEYEVLVLRRSSRSLRSNKSDPSAQASATTPAPPPPPGHRLPRRFAGCQGLGDPGAPAPHRGPVGRRPDRIHRCPGYALDRDACRLDRTRSGDCCRGRSHEGDVLAPRGTRTSRPHTRGRSRWLAPASGVLHRLLGCR